MEYSITSSIAFDETSSNWSAPKRSRLFIGHHTVVWFLLVSIPNHEGSTFVEKDRNKLKVVIITNLEQKQKSA